MPEKSKSVLDKDNRKALERMRTEEILGRAYRSEAGFLENHVVIDRGLAIWQMTRRFGKELGYTPKELRRRNLGDLLPNGGKAKVQELFSSGRKEVRVGDIPLRHKNGSRIYFDVVARKIERRWAILSLREVMYAAHDRLTGLLNRETFEEMVKQEIRFASRLAKEKESFFVFFLDVNDFKSINDTFGHAEGDEALKIVARAVRETFRISDLVCRWGGDEFAALALFPAEEGEEIAEAMINRLDERLGELCAAKDYKITVSAGVHCHNKIASWDKSVREADRKMYAAKKGKKPRPSLPAERSKNPQDYRQGKGGGNGQNDREDEPRADRTARAFSQARVPGRVL